MMGLRPPASGSPLGPEPLDPPALAAIAAMRGCAPAAPWRAAPRVPGPQWAPPGPPGGSLRRPQTRYCVRAWARAAASLAAASPLPRPFCPLRWLPPRGPCPWARPLRGGPPAACLRPCRLRPGLPRSALFAGAPSPAPCGARCRPCAWAPLRCAAGSLFGRPCFALARRCASGRPAPSSRRPPSGFGACPPRCARRRRLLAPGRWAACAALWAALRPGALWVLGGPARLRYPFPSGLAGRAFARAASPALCLPWGSPLRPSRPCRPRWGLRGSARLRLWGPAGPRRGCRF